MKKIFTLLFFASCLTAMMAQKTIYGFNVTDNQGNKVPLSQYKGKVILIVNTATHCGFTPQYNDLDSLYAMYAQKGFEILDFPCNQFGAQAPGTDDEIQKFCTLRYHTEFPRFHKIDVNGKKAIPLYKFLKKQKGFAGFDPNHPLTKVLDNMFRQADPEYDKNPDIKWNFTKFLIDKEGHVVARFEPTATFETLAPAIEELLK